jgi:DMSO reductase anchor subunit
VAALSVAVLAMIGLLAERWLFFADARHTVRLYHGDART